MGQKIAKGKNLRFIFTPANIVSQTKEKRAKKLVPVKKMMLKF